MRTKTLLLTAALAAAGAASAMAQQVYSVNAVGYVNKTVVSGYNLVANPFVVGNDAIGTLIPAGSIDHAIQVFYLDDAGAFHPNGYDPDPSIGWDDPSMHVPLGGGIIVNNTGPQFTVTFVGEVAQGTLHNPVPDTSLVPGNYVVRSSKVPQQAGPTALGFLPANNAQMYRYDTDGATFIPNGYDPTVPGWDSEANIGIAEAFFISCGGGTAWDRTFSVN